MSPEISEVLKGIVGAFVRWLAGIVFGWLVLNNVVTPEEAQRWTSLLVLAVPGLLITLAWSVYNKYRLNTKIDKALDLPKGTPREVLEKKTSLVT